MTASSDALKEEMIQSDDDFRRLHEEHQELERRLESLYDKSLLSEEDERELKRIKHEKLRLKDQMMTMMQTEQEAPESAQMSA